MSLAGGIIELMKGEEGVGKFFRVINNAEEWKFLLAKPDKHWKSGYSAKTLAYCWQEAGDFPSEVKRVFHKSGIDVFKDIEILVALPEYKTPLLGGRRASQSDILVLAKGNGQLVSITVEGKVAEPFGDIVSEWKVHDKGGKEVRLMYLCELLALDALTVSHIRYQLLHRTASALIEAKRFNAPNALMLVHSFSLHNEGFEDYEQFLALFRVKAKVDSLVFAGNINGIKLHCAWVKGNTKYLDK